MYRYEYDSLEFDMIVHDNYGLVFRIHRDINAKYNLYMLIYMYMIEICKSFKSTFCAKQI